MTPVAGGLQVPFLGAEEVRRGTGWALPPKESWRSIAETCRPILLLDKFQRRVGCPWREGTECISCSFICQGRAPFLSVGETLCQPAARTNRQVSGRVTARRSLGWTAHEEGWKMHDGCPLLDGGYNQPSDSEGTSLVSHRGGQLLGSNALQIPPRSSLEEKGPCYPASRKGA